MPDRHQTPIRRGPVLLGKGALSKLAALKQHFVSFALSCDARRVLKRKVKTERKYNPFEGA